jgi:adenosylcobinamide amidohydrolase
MNRQPATGGKGCDVNAVTREAGETLRRYDHYTIRRRGRFLVADLLGPHRVLSNAARNGGLMTSIGYLVNHQSCEAVGHAERHKSIHGEGGQPYHDRVCGEARVDPERTVLMGTAANMNYASLAEYGSGGVVVLAVVTAGVSGNATCAADPTNWHERDGRFEPVAPFSGTINTMVLVNRPLSAGAHAGAAVSMTEAKGAALHRLAVRSRYSREFATGTSTDQFCIACPQEGGPELTSASTGVRLGELVGMAVRDATLEALRWQNGLEPSYARSLFHALGRYGLEEERFAEQVAPLLTEAHAELLGSNRKAVAYEPLVAASAYAMATVLDRLRHGILPTGAAGEALRHQAASMAAALAAKPERWGDFYAGFGTPDVEDPLPLILEAIAAGWSAKWAS